MKLLLALLAGPTVALAACEITQLLTDYSWILNTESADGELAKICGDAKIKQARVDGIKQIVEDCINDDTTKASIKPIFDIIGDVLCATSTSGTDATKEEFCLPSLASMLPLIEILQGASSGGLDVNLLSIAPQLRDADKLTTICRTNTCTQDIAKIAIKAVRASGLDSPFVKDVISSTGAACLSSGDDFCSKTSFYTEAGDIDAGKACKGKRLIACARKVLSVVGVDEKFSAKDLCGSTGLSQEALGGAVLKLKGVAMQYFEDNKKEVLAALGSDLGFNLPGLLPENLDLTITPNIAEKTITVKVSVVGGKDLTTDIDINVALNVFKKLLEDGKASSPAMDTMQGLIEGGMVSDTMRLTAIESTLDSIPAADADAGAVGSGDGDDGSDGTTTDSLDNQSSAARLGASTAVVLLAAAMAM